MYAFYELAKHSVSSYACYFTKCSSLKSSKKLSHAQYRQSVMTCLVPKVTSFVLYWSFKDNEAKFQILPTLDHVDKSFCYFFLLL